MTVFNQFQSFITAWNLQDKRLKEYTYKRLYSGMEASILFNTFHPDAHKNRSEQKKEIQNILNKREIIQCLDFMRKCPMGIEQRLFYQAYKHKTFFDIIFYRVLFRILRKIKNILS